MRQLDRDGNDNAERIGKILGYEVSASSKLQPQSNDVAMVNIKEEKVDYFGLVSASCDAFDSNLDSLEVDRVGKRKRNNSDSSLPMSDEAGACPFVAPVSHSAKDMENADNAGEDYEDGSVKKADIMQFSRDEINSDYTLTATKPDSLEALADSTAASVDSDRNGEVDSLPLFGTPEKADELFKAETADNHNQNLTTRVKNDGSMELSASDNNVKKEKHSVDASSSKASGGRSAVPRTSIYHGVTRHRWSGKYEAHLWDSTCRLEGRRRKGKQVYLGSYDTEQKAARSYDIAALKYWGADTKLNFHVCQYEKELEDIRDMSREECITYLRRRSSCFSRGASVYRGVTRRQRDGRWQARIGRVAGNKDIYLGTFKTEEEAAEAYDIAAIELRGMSAITNFDISNYCEKGLGLGLGLGIGLESPQDNEERDDGK